MAYILQTIILSLITHLTKEVGMLFKKSDFSMSALQLGMWEYLTNLIDKSPNSNRSDVEVIGEEALINVEINEVIVV